MSTGIQSQFHAWIRALPKTTVATGLMLLAIRSQDDQMLAAIAVYLSRDFGATAFADWLIDDLEPLLTEVECRWMYSQIHCHGGKSDG